MIDNPIGAQIFADAKNPDLNTLWVTQSGLGLPERDYYFSDDKRFTEIRARLRAAHRQRVQAGRPQGLAPRWQRT